jgi:hypothetical protein
MALRNKRGWLRIFEAILGIMILAGAILFFYSKNIDKADSSDYIYQLQLSVLNEIELNNTLRQNVLDYSIGDIPESIKKIAEKKIPSNFNFEVKICEINNEVQCKKNYVEKQVYAMDKIIASTISSTSLAPKKVRLFVWEK